MTTRAEARGNAFWEREVLRLDLNMDREDALWRDEGNVFQIVGAWYEKDLCPWDLGLTFRITSFS